MAGSKLKMHNRVGGEREADERKESIQALSSKHRELMRLLLLDVTHAEASARTGIPKAHVTRLAHAELCKSEMAKMQDDLDKYLYDNTIASLTEIREMNLAEAKNNLATRIDIRDKEVKSPASRLKACDAMDEVAGIKLVEPPKQVIEIGVEDGLKAMLATALVEGNAKDAPNAE